MSRASDRRFDYARNQVARRLCAAAPIQSNSIGISGRRVKFSSKVPIQVDDLLSAHTQLDVNVKCVIIK